MRAAVQAAPRERPIIFGGEMIPPILDDRKTQTRRVITPQPPSVDAVRQRAGIGFSIFTDHHAKPDEFRVAGPVWAVRDIMGSREPRWRCPYGAPGDRLWVKEAFAYSVRDPEAFNEPGVYTEDSHEIVYRASSEGQGEWRHYDGDGGVTPTAPPWRSPRFMPRWASRITLEVVSVRVERVQDITEEDALAEGIVCWDPGPEHAAIVGGANAFRPPGATDFLGGYSAVAAFERLWESLNRKRAPWESNPWVWVVEFRRLAS